MKTHTDLLNHIAKLINAKYYLEIGVLNVANNFKKIDVEFKEGVDPDVDHPAISKMTSDDFFPSEDRWFEKYDLIFVDGLHHADQSKRDAIHSYESLNDGGVMLIHDCNPMSEKITHEPRDNKEWCGGVYKTVSQITSSKFTIDFDYGCCIIHKTEQSLTFHNDEITWDYFDSNRKRLLNLVSMDEALKIMQEWT